MRFFYYIDISPSGQIDTHPLPARAEDHTDSPESFFGQRLMMEVPQTVPVACWPFTRMYPICEGLAVAWGRLP